jgi:drug/metabolite transporter (DMT)-like permease
MLSSLKGHLPTLSLFTGVIIISTSPLLIRIAGAPGEITAFYRTAIAAAVWAVPFAFNLKKNSVRFTLKKLLFPIVGGIFLGLDLALWSSGVVMSGATNPTLMANTAPLWVGLGSWLLFRERLSRFFWIGLILAMSGAFMVLGLDTRISMQTGTGTLYGLAGAVFYGGFILITQKGRGVMDTTSYFFITTLAAAFSLFLICLATGQSLIGYDSVTWLVFFALAVIGHLAGWLFITYAQGYLPASIIAPSLLGQPVLCAVFSYVILDEKLTLLHILGGAIVLSGIVLIHRKAFP